MNMYNNRKNFPRAFFFHFRMAWLFTAFFVLTEVGAQEDLKVFQGNWMHFSDAPNYLYKHFSEEAFELLKARKKEVSEITTLKAWKERQEWIKKQLSAVLGPFPPKTPLNSQVLRRMEKNGYVLEHIIFESQPDFYVTSTLYIPDGIQGKAPVIIYCSGHTEEGYRSSTYQTVILNLVKKGFMVFAFDPVGQGERLEYYDVNKGGSKIGGATMEHSYPGAQAFISGKSQAWYMTWDGIRAVDYLLSRAEVDPKRIGITGRSGGGTQSFYIAAMDDRIWASAPENYITNYTRLFQTIGPQDAEQNLYQGIKMGLDHPDLLSVRAPKPTLMITTTRDFFNIQGARETAAEVENIYRAYGKEQNFSMVEDDAEHASTQKNREAMYAFFQRHLNLPGSARDEEVDLLEEADLKVTPTGQLATSYRGETVFSLNKKSTPEPPKIGSKNSGTTQALTHSVKAARQLSGFREIRESSEPVLTGRIQKDGYHIEKYFVKGEGNYHIPFLLMVPKVANQKAVLYISSVEKSEEARPGGEMESLVKRGFTVLSPDLLGYGEVGKPRPSAPTNFGHTSFNLWFAALQVGRSIVGLQAGDMVRLGRVLKNTFEQVEVYGLAKNELGPSLLHAAAFDPVFVGIALENSPASYKTLVDHRFYLTSYILGAVPASLMQYDLPLLAASLAPRKLLLIQPKAGTGEEMGSDTFQESYAVVTTAYNKLGAKDQLKVKQNISNEERNGLFLEWLE
ncbi:MAG: alpha/beta hydrolase family protein [Cyclobacteriaceae bacterium]